MTLVQTVLNLTCAELMRKANQLGPPYSDLSLLCFEQINVWISMMPVI